MDISIERQLKTDILFLLAMPIELNLSFATSRVFLRRHLSIFTV